MITLNIGDEAPGFELMDEDGKKTALSDFKGRKIIVYFYPKDDTSGCTKEACNFRDNFKELKKLNVEVLGISNDDHASHKKFSEKFNLPFRLLCDVDKKISNEYGVYELKKFMGKSYFGIVRSTFVIDERGKIVKIFYNVNPEKHIDEVLKVLR